MHDRDSTHNGRNYMTLNVLRMPSFTEGLTKIRSKLLFDMRSSLSLVGVKTLQSAYASDGKLVVKDNDDERHLIK